MAVAFHVYTGKGFYGAQLNGIPLKGNAFAINSKLSGDMCRTGNVFGEQRSCRRRSRRSRKAFEVSCIDMRLCRIRCSQLRIGGGVDGRQTGDELDRGPADDDDDDDDCERLDF